MEPTILFEDAEMIVVNKPAGMIVYSDGKHDYPALDEWLKNKFGEIFVVHRLDRETSGVIVFARTEKTQEFLRDQFRNRETRKTYRAFVYGVTNERGIIDKPIGSTRGGLGPRSAKKPYGQLRDAVTVYRRIKNNAETTYVEVFPKTGRTHQIRVHFAAIQHPIVGDSMYAPGRPASLGFKRTALHALALALKHPGGKEMNFEAPLPEDFIAAQNLL